MTNPVQIPDVAVQEAEAVIERCGEEFTAAALIGYLAGYLRENGKAVLTTSDSNLGKQILEFKLAADNLRALSAEPAQGEQWQPTHRHVKRGTEYQLIGTGKMQAEKWVDGSTIKPINTAKGRLEISSDLIDMQEVAIYRGDDGQLRVRPIEEFNDGRFETLPAAPTPEAE